MYQSTDNAQPLPLSGAQGYGTPQKPPRAPRHLTQTQQQQQQPAKLQAIPVDHSHMEDGEQQPLIRGNYPPALSQPAAGMQPCYWLLYLATFLFAATLCYAIVALTQSFACLGAPYLYVTHKGSKNIMKYSRDGCLLHEKVLWGVSNQKADLRSMAFGRYKGDEQALFVADSSNQSGSLMVFGSCFQSTSLRPFLTRAVSQRGAQHAYGLALDRDSSVYMSFQDTDAVLRFAADSFQPLPVPEDDNLTPIAVAKGVPAQYANSNSNSSEKHGKKHNSSAPLRGRRRLSTPSEVLYEGSFVQFAGGGRGVRAVAWVGGGSELWVAHEDSHTIVIVDRAGHLLGSVSIVNPIGLHYAASNSSASSGMVFVSSKAASGSSKKHSSGGAVYAVDVSSRKIVRTYSSLGMKHPAGMAVHEDVLFVSDQTRGAILAFNMSTTRILQLIVPKHSLKGGLGMGPIEQMLLSPC